MRWVLLTAGLNSPPLIRKKTHALTASEKPKLKLIYSNWAGLLCFIVVVTVVPVLLFDEIFATCAPAKPKNRKKMVPAISPIAATICPLAAGGNLPRALFVHVICGLSGAVTKAPGRCWPGLEIFIVGTWRLTRDEVTLEVLEIYA